MKSDRWDEQNRRMRFSELSRTWFVWNEDKWQWEPMEVPPAPPDIDESMRVTDAESAHEQALAHDQERYPGRLVIDGQGTPETPIPEMPPFVPANQRDEGEAADREAARLDDERWRYS